MQLNVVGLSTNQYVDRPTRSRANDTPSILDLVLSNEELISNIEYFSPSGKNDHSVLLVSVCDFVRPKISGDRLNLNKGNYKKMKEEMNIDWNSVLLPHKNNIDTMWEVFKEKIQICIKNHVPKTTFWILEKKTMEASN
jgi:hypothetical protein